MANNTQSPKPKSQSPSRPSAFQWPVPNSYDSNISVREIIEKYYPNDHELLKHALMAKAEEDRVRIYFICYFFLLWWEYMKKEKKKWKKLIYFLFISRNKQLKTF
jgi:hypothetical protein